MLILINNNCIFYDNYFIYILKFLNFKNIYSIIENEIIFTYNSYTYIEIIYKNL